MVFPPGDLNFQEIKSGKWEYPFTRKFPVLYPFPYKNLPTGWVIAIIRATSGVGQSEWLGSRSAGEANMGMGREMETVRALQRSCGERLAKVGGA